MNVGRVTGYLRGFTLVRYIIFKITKCNTTSHYSTKVSPVLSEESLKVKCISKLPRGLSL